MRFLHACKRPIGQIPVAGAECLIPLKARAWLDLTARKNQGEAIDSKTIHKHKNDIVRLYQVVDPVFTIEVPARIRTDMAECLTALASESIDLRSLGIRKKNWAEVLADLRSMYGS